MRIKALSRKEINKALPFIWDVFLEYETVNYSEKRKQAFWDAIHSEEYLAQLKAYGAFENKEIVGIIATRNEGSHVALFFVKGMYQGKGIGRMLWNAVLEENIINTVTVYSSLFAVPIYEKLGFISTDNIQEDGGIGNEGLKMVKDHLGKSYQSVKEMCSAYNISYAVFLDRRSLSWLLEDCLTVKIVDHKGRDYKSEEEMCNYGFSGRGQQ